MKNLFLLFVVSLLALSAAEAAFRLFSPNIAYIETAVHGQFDADVGYTYAPNARFRHRRGRCIDVGGIQTNRFGFRDEDWGSKDRGGIAILGDSYMAAFQVGTGDLLPDILERVLGVPVLNFGVGGYNTIASLRAYEKFARLMKPRLVVHYVLVGNDITENDPAFLLQDMEGLALPTGYVDEGTVKYLSPLGGRTHFEMLSRRATFELREHCYLCRAL